MDPAPTIHRLREVGSTQDAARELARAGAPPFTAVMAESQSDGRGRLGRRWHSAPGLGLYLSVVLRPLPAPELARSGLAAGVAVREALVTSAPWCDRRLCLKWPNDIVLEDGRKLAGLLLEAESGPRPIAVLGIGANLGHAEADFPEELRGVSSSVRMETGVAPEAGVIAASILERLAVWLSTMEVGGFEPIREAFMAVAWPALGDRIDVRDGAEIVPGSFQGVDMSGALLLAVDGGTRAIVSAEEVRVHRGPGRSR